MKVSYTKIKASDKFKLLWLISTLKLKNRLLNIISSSVSSGKIKTPKRILILRQGSLGDSICALPAIASIQAHFNYAVIDIMTSSGKKGYVSLEEILNRSYYNQCIKFLEKGWINFLRTQGKMNYDLLIILPGRRESQRFQILAPILFRILGIKKSIGWEIAFSPYFKRTQETYIEFNNEIDRLLKIVGKHGIFPDKTKNRFPLNIQLTDQAKVNDLLSEFRLSDSRKSIGLVIGANRKHNEWGKDNYLKLASSLTERGYNIFLIGGSKDKAQSLFFSKIENVYDFCGKLSVIQSGLLMQKCRLIVSNDTGPMHLAYALKVPLIAIFSTWEFSGQWYPPQNDTTIIIRPPLISCSICLKENCPNDNLCISLVEPSRVLSEVERLLSRLGMK